MRRAGDLPDRAMRSFRVTDEQLRAAVTACTQAGAELVYLFGSQAKGKIWSESDVDLAVRLGAGGPRQRYGEVRIQLIGELMSVFASTAGSRCGN